MDRWVSLFLQDGIALITLQNPKIKNALSLAVIKELNEVLDKVENDNHIRVAIFTGAGHEAFCGGADLKERFTMSEKESFLCVQSLQATFDRIANLKFPTIAAINGIAFGGGLELALACDLRLASFNALMGLTECLLGIIPGAGGTKRLPKIIGPARAMELIFTAKKISSEEAEKIGLLNGVALEGESVLDLAYKMAQSIAALATLAVRAAKKAILADSIQKKDLEHELSCYNEILYTKDRKEGLNAFKEKRQPVFVGE